MKRKLFTYLIIFTCIVANAQLGKEAWHWQFGRHCALNFSSGAPVIDSSSINSDEGCASISDKNTGQLLFYTDGVSVWNRNNILMPNGDSLFGSYTTTQSALIVPKPGTENLYYIFTCDYQGHSHGVCYSLVNMLLNGGMGDITIKNQLLTPAPMTEKLTAVRHCNGIDFWIIDHPLGSNAFNVYLLDATGINLIPVVSNVGTMESNIGQNAIGYLKASPNGKKLALASIYLNVTEIYDFNNANGTINNPVVITYTYGLGTYGVSFSPDNSKLYASNDNNGKLYQYNLTSNVPATIIASQTVIDSANGDIEALQLGPDGKIYGIHYSNQSLCVINNPNALGLACNFQLNTVAFPYPISPRFGLPNFIDGGLSLRNDTQSIITCNNAFPISLSADSGITNFLWSNGATTQTTSVTNFGNYWVSYTNNVGCKETDTFHIIQTQPSIINQLKDTVICSNISVSIGINATYPNTASYNWSDGFNQPVHTITTQGVYWVDYTLNNFCHARDSFNFYVDSVPSINLGKDTALCKPYTLKANAGEQYDWSNGATSQQITVATTGMYSVTVTSPQGCKNSDTINVTIYTPPLINVLHDSTECGNSFSPVNVNATYPNTILYNWNDGFIGQSHSITTQGTYWVDYTLNNFCVSRDSFNLYLYPYPIVSLGDDTTFCHGSKALNAFNSSCTYLWSTGETTPAIIGTHTGTYWVQVNRYGCISTDTLLVNPEYSMFNFVIPNVVTPNNDNINDEIDFGKYQFSSLQLEIYNRWGNKIFESSDPKCTWKPTVDDGTYFYTAQYRIDCGSATETKTLKGFITVVR